MTKLCEMSGDNVQPTMVQSYGNSKYPGIIEKPQLSKRVVYIEKALEFLFIIFAII